MACATSPPTCPSFLAPTSPSTTTSENLRNTGSGRTTCDRPDAPSAAVSSMTTTAASRPVSADRRRHDGGRRQGPILAQFTCDEILQPERLGAAQFPDGMRAPGGLELPRVPRQQLLLMDLIQYCRNHSIDPRSLSCPTCRNASSSTETRRQCPRADSQLHHGAQESCRDRPAQRGNDLGRQPLLIYALFRKPTSDPRDVGRAEAEHRLRHRQVGARPQPDQCRRTDAGIWWRRSPRRRHLPGAERSRPTRRSGN